MSAEIQYLDNKTISSIAAGEVVENPSSIVKELVENSIDANASNITIHLTNGGKTMISIVDNGNGMNATNLEKSVDRHATSKLINNNIFDLQFMGFRGEALSSIGAVSHMKIVSKESGIENKLGHQIEVKYGDKSTISETITSHGTHITVENLFASIPVRLKFLKSDNAEKKLVENMIRRMIIAYPNIQFELYHNHKEILNTKKIVNYIDGKEYTNQEARLCYELGEEFGKNFFYFEGEMEELYAYGYLSYPTVSNRNLDKLIIFANNRIIRDRRISNIVKAMYFDVMSHDRCPMGAIFLFGSYSILDVNVHPNKYEVRFRNYDIVKNLLREYCKKKIAISAPSSVLGGQLLDKSYGPTSSNINQSHRFSNSLNKIDQERLDTSISKTSTQMNFTEDFTKDHSNKSMDNIKESYSVLNDSSHFQLDIPKSFNLENTNYKKPDSEFQEFQFNSTNTTDTFLGYAKAQLHDLYIVSEVEDGIIIVDSHAAHERILYEQLKFELANRHKNGEGIERQRHLIPETLSISKAEFEMAQEYSDYILQYGFELELSSNFEDNIYSISILETPAILKYCNGEEMIRGIISILQNNEENINNIEEKILYYYRTVACHNSIRAGKKLSIDEMNSLLRQIEQTENSSQCNHGRPTYIRLYKKDIDKMFDR